ncbi:MAG TPA: GAF domain-containing protein [Candidatus Polarisedimenticolia bacterium]|nr:GAF domain-containing protein [Candidatus Polarisedimenticolia bacterium]
MARSGFTAADGLGYIDELVRLTAPPLREADICREGLALIAEALGARGGSFVMSAGPGAPPVGIASWGEAPESDLAEFMRECVEAKGDLHEVGSSRGSSPARVTIPVPVDAGAAGLLVLDRPSRWGKPARDFALSAARILAGSLRAARIIDEARRQGEALAQRNVELEALGKLAAMLQELDREDDLLQAALDLVLERLALNSGWIFWGHESLGRLELAASRGLSADFIERSRRQGIGTCLCLDVFATGRLKVARNTTECPRLPELVSGRERMTHACIPLKFERGVLGVMNIANHPGRTFSQEELHFLEIVGNQLCMAVDKARIARAEARRNAESRALTDLARSIGGSLDLDRVLAATGEYARDLLSAHRCAIFLGNGPDLDFAYLTGPPMEGLVLGRPANLETLGSRALPEVIRSRRPLVVTDAAADAASNADLAQRWEIGSAILVPLVTHDSLAGILQATRTVPSTWTKEEVELADALGRQAAVAIENARLYREAKDALLKLQQAQYDMMKSERMAAVGTLASSLAHEVRNPLNSISLQLVLLSRRVARGGQGADGEIASLVETARREIDRLDMLVGDFLSLSSIDRVRLKEQDLWEVVREVLALLIPVASQKGLTLAEGAGDSLPPLLLDREKIKQVLINLVRNAIEATSEGGSVTISARLSGDSVVLEVTDTGVGIEPGLDVFDFFTTTKRGGTGLGLPIARRILEAHGGSLTFESEPGLGTTFFVTFKVPEPGRPTIEAGGAR